MAELRLREWEFSCLDNGTGISPLNSTKFKLKVFLKFILTYFYCIKNETDDFGQEKTLFQIDNRVNVITLFLNSLPYNFLTV